MGWRFCASFHIHVYGAALLQVLVGHLTTASIEANIQALLHLSGCQTHPCIQTADQPSCTAGLLGTALNCCSCACMVWGCRAWLVGFWFLLRVSGMHLAEWQLSRLIFAAAA